MHNYSVYILANSKNGTLYVGVTNGLAKRIYQHKGKQIKGFTSKYQLNLLVYYEMFNSIESAIKREKQLKHWKREWKIELIEENNPEWKDLYEDIV